MQSWAMLQQDNTIMSDQLFPAILKMLKQKKKQGFHIDLEVEYK